jgi:RNA-directed DNA polymerase (reverse transcriptase)
MDAEETASGLPELPDVEALAELLRIAPKWLYRISNHTPRFYRVYAIPKRNGKFRIIEAPRPLLKRLQRRILTSLLNPVEASPYATAFERGKNIADNARFHLNQPVVLKLDIRNFFPSLKSPPVYRLFLELGHPPPVAALLTRLCCLCGHLPQGAPTSPRLANLLLRPADYRIAAWIGRRPIQFTRYADDITLSGDFGPEHIAEAIQVCRHELGRLGLRLNRGKIRIERRCRRQTVTGLTVNETLHAPRQMIRKLRQEMFYIRKYGWEDRPESELHRLIGIANFIRDVDPGDAACTAHLEKLHAILWNRRQKQLSEQFRRGL